LNRRAGCVPAHCACFGGPVMPAPARSPTGTDMIHLRFATGAAVLALAATQAHAADSTAAPSWRPDDIIITATLEGQGYASLTASATRTPVPLLNVPQSVQVLNETLIREQALTTLAGALTNVSGVVASRPQEAVLAYPIIRGFAADIRIGSGAEPSGEFLTYLYLILHKGFIELLLIGIHHDKLNICHPGSHHPADRVCSGSADSDHLDDRVYRFAFLELEHKSSRYPDIFSPLHIQKRRSGAHPTFHMFYAN